MKKESVKYKNFEYRDLGSGKWEIKFPSGFKTTLSLANEEVVKAHIDMLRTEFNDPN